MADENSTIRPSFIDIESRTTSAASSYTRAMFSPRIQHFAGDVPPALSPLDAIAAESRRLAKELEETRVAGSRRLSRLAPQVVTKSLTQHKATRPLCFRSLSDNAESPPLEKQVSGSSPEVSEPTTRPNSQHPRFSNVPNLSFDDEQDYFSTPKEYPQEFHTVRTPTNYFEIPRSLSPDPVDTIRHGQEDHRQSGDIQDQLMSRQKSSASQPDLTFTLAPPIAAFARKGTNRSQHDSSDEDYASSNAGSTFSQNRKLSSNSATSIPHSPSHTRSGSGNSISSTLSYSKSRSHFNYSRPMSNAKQEYLESPSRQQSNASQKSHPTSHPIDFPQSPTSFGETRSEAPDGQVSAPVTSYTYEKFSLLRGQQQIRESMIFSGLSTPNFEWQEPLFPSTPPMRAMSDKELSTPSPPSSGRVTKSFEDHGWPRKGGFSFEFGKADSTNPEKPFFPLNSSSSPKSPRNKLQKRPVTSPAPGPIVAETPPILDVPATSPVQIDLAPIPPPDFLSSSSRSNSTVRPQTSRTQSNYPDFSANDHVSKGIELHQSGDLKASTYHLRIAAKQNNATGMLLYALACRHGWGVRANPREGVEWLRKAVDCAMLEVADDENSTPEISKGDVKYKKAHRAQFALAIYELGISHLNGWGTEQDKALALRCFEIAGNWGDVDALSEAGLCYAEGIGCKKDLKKAAKWYRMAEANGASMLGNSWIHKEKYDEKGDEPNSESNKDDTPGRRSRSRSIWQRKKNEKAEKA